MLALFIGFAIVVASAAGFGYALFGRRPVPQPAMAAPASPRETTTGPETAPSPSRRRPIPGYGTPGAATGDTPSGETSSRGTASAGSGTGTERQAPERAADPRSAEFDAAQRAPHGVRDDVAGAAEEPGDGHAVRPDDVDVPLGRRLRSAALLAVSVLGAALLLGAILSIIVVGAVILVA